MNIYDTNSSFLYAYRNKQNGMMNIGSKTPRGEKKETYITSLHEDSPFWTEYANKNMVKSHLFIGEEATVKALEWFALDYGTKVMPDKFYNSKNTAHRGDQSLLSQKMMQDVIDYIEGRSNGIDIIDDGDESLSGKIVDSLMQRIANGEFKVHQLPVTEVYSYQRSQVRYEKINHATVNEIKTLMEQEPVKARETFKPVIIVNGEERRVVDGNTRLGAAYKAKGWKQSLIPVILIDEREFGETEERREDTIRLFGVSANAKAFEVKVPNSDADILREINNFLCDKNLDFNDELHKDHARELLYQRFYPRVIPSRQKISGLFKKFINDWDKTQTELKYQKNLITYDEAFFTKYAWDNYGSKGVASIHATVGECSLGKPLAYIQRHMRTKKCHKGAIILHYTKKSDLENNQDIEDIEDVIRFHKLPIVVDVLPAFEK